MNISASYKGLDKDTSHLYYPKNKYYHMENFKVVTDGGSSTLAIENEKGNQLDFTIPDTQGVYKIFSGRGAITINGTQIVIGNRENDSTILEYFYKQVVETFGSAIGVDFNIYLSDNYVLLFGLNNLVVTANFSNLIETVVPAILSSDMKVIHMDHFSDNSGDYIVIFTTNETTDNPSIGTGQIWLVEYNEQTNVVTNLNAGLLNPQYHLKYNNLLNLSTSNYIRRSLCRFESSSTARVYWTDNYNPARSFNLFDPEGYAILPADLDFVSNITFTKPIITDISDTGKIPAGSQVQFYYQLRAGGRETIISPGSDLLPISNIDDETTSFILTEGSTQGQAATKAVSYVIKNIDEDYDIIRHIAVIYEFENLPVIKLFKEELIPSSREINVTFTNDEDYIFFTEQDLNALNTQFTVCKDLAHKDNRLIAVNTRSTKFEITDNEYDSRAYRFKSDGTSAVRDKSNVLLSVDTTYDVPFIHDAINPFNDEADINYGLYKYQSDGITLGGSGPNISYEFITRSIINDEKGAAGTPNFAGIEDNHRVELVEGDYTFQNQFKHFKSPYVHMMYGGYMRDEIYRFGIVFYSKKGNPSFVKWIGDIKFPTIQEETINEIGTSPSTGNTALFAKQLGIKFNITIPTALSDKISGYEIVRVERGETDRTRITGGLFLPLAPSGINNEGIGGVTGSNNYDGSNGRNLFNFITPWHQFRTYTKADFNASDFIRLSTYYTTPTDTVSNNFTSVNGFLGYKKMRVPSSFMNLDIPLKAARFVGRGSSFDISNILEPSNPFIYQNYDSLNRAYGAHYVFAADAGFTLPATNDINPYGTYCRLVTNQYGGNSYESRSNNIYITTGVYIDINLSSNLDVFGGDTYCNYFDYELIQANDAATASDKYVSAVVFTCESPFNVDLRHGNHFSDNRDEPDGSTWLNYTEETYLINPVYLQSNTSKQIFIAKPFNINLEDEQPYAIWVSELKINGEQIDSWVKFRINNQIEVDGIHGPINGVVNHQGRVYFFQNRATGVVPVNERIVTQTTDGIELTLGTGDVISNYGYISTKIGCFHTSSIVQSEDYFYFFDVRSKKFYRMSIDSKEPLSDIKGLSSYFNSFVKGSKIEDIDKKGNIESIGIHGAYDPRFNRVLYTLNKGYTNEITERNLVEGNTISYNEFLNSFESFYSFKPCVYLSTGRRLLTVNAIDATQRNKVWQHNIGNYGEFYGTIYDSNITYNINGESADTKEWNNLSWYSECYDINNLDIPNETFDKIRIYNDHQTTGQIILSQGSIKRRFRYWYHSILRDINSYQSRGRIRNPWILLELNKDNTNNNRFICHDMNAHYLL